MKYYVDRLNVEKTLTTVFGTYSSGGYNREGDPALMRSLFLDFIESTVGQMVSNNAFNAMHAHYTRFGYSCLHSSSGGPDPVRKTDLFGARKKYSSVRFAERKRNGEIVVNPHSVWKCTAECVPGRITTTPASSPGDLYMSGASTRSGIYNIYWTPIYERVYEEVVLPFGIEQLEPFDNEAFKGLQEIRTTVVNEAIGEADSLIFDLLTNLAELPETLRWIVDLLKQAKDAQEAARKKEVEVRSLLRRKGRTAEQIARAIASVWMQYRYAIGPIVMSLEDAADALHLWRRTYGKTTKGDLVHINEEQLRSEFQIPLEYSVVVSSAYIQHRCFIKRAFSPEGLVDALLGVLKLNPITTAYELVPLSFVVDWFINIGEVLTISTTPTRHIDQGATYSWKTVVNITVVDPESKAYYGIDYQGYVRSVIDPYTEYGLVMGWDMNWKRYLDSISLLLNPTLNSLKRHNRR